MFRIFFSNTSLRDQPIVDENYLAHVNQKLSKATGRLAKSTPA